jgi:membrane protein YqaA with SNARE-associated domain
VLLLTLGVANPERALFYGLVCTVGSVLGRGLGDAIGPYGGRPILRRFFNPTKVAAVERLYDKHNAWATGIAGLTPIPHKVFTIAGGAFKINFTIFMIASVASRGLRFMAEGRCSTFSASRSGTSCTMTSTGSRSPSWSCSSAASGSCNGWARGRTARRLRRETRGPRRQTRGPAYPRSEGPPQRSRPATFDPASLLC